MPFFALQRTNARPCFAGDPPKFFTMLIWNIPSEPFVLRPPFLFSLFCLNVFWLIVSRVYYALSPVVSPFHWYGGDCASDERRIIDALVFPFALRELPWIHTDSGTSSENLGVFTSLRSCDIQWDCRFYDCKLERRDDAKFYPQTPWRSDHSRHRWSFATTFQSIVLVPVYLWP